LIRDFGLPNQQTYSQHTNVKRKSETIKDVL